MQGILHPFHHSSQKTTHQHCYICQVSNCIEIIKGNILKLGETMTTQLIQFKLGQLDSLHKIAYNTRSHTKTSWPFAILMSLWTHSNNGNKHGNPKRNSMSYKTLKFLLVVSFFGLSTCIFIMRGWYVEQIIFEGKSIEMQWVLTFYKILLPFVLKRFTSFWNSVNFFRL